jgi:PAS domain S-box-containing protein
MVPRRSRIDPILVMLGAVCAIHSVALQPPDLPLHAAVLCLMVAYAASLAGRWAGATAVMIGVVYEGTRAAVGASLSWAEAPRLLVSILAVPLAAILIGFVRSRIEMDAFDQAEAWVRSVELQTSRVRVEARGLLNESDMRFQTLFDSSPAAYFETDSRGTVRRVNEAACRLLKKGRDRMIGRQLASLLSPANSEGLDLGIAQALTSGQNAAFEAEYESGLRFHLFAAVVANQRGKATGLIVTAEHAAVAAYTGAENRRMLVAREGLRNIARESLALGGRRAIAAGNVPCGDSAGV